MRRDGGGDRRRNRRRRAALASSGPRSSRRRRPSIASGAASCPSWRRGSTCATSAASSKRRSTQAGAARHDVGAVAVTQGPGLVGSLLVGVAFAKAYRVGAGHSGHPRPPSGRAHRIADARARRAAAAGGRPRRLRRPHEPLPRARSQASTGSSAGRATMRRARRTTRWPSCWASATRAGRCIDRLAREGREDRFSFPATRLTHADRNAPRATGADLLPPEVARRTDFSFQRPEDGRAAARAGAQRAPRRAGSSLPAAGRRRHLRQLSARRGRRAARSDVRGGGVARRPERRHRRRRLGQQPAASGRRGPRRAAGPAGLRAADRALDRQRGHDRRRRPAPSIAPASSAPGTSTPKHRLPLSV